MKPEEMNQLVFSTPLKKEDPIPELSGVSTIRLFFGDKYKHIIPVLDEATGHIRRHRLSADGHLGSISEDCA
jgi:hypothetical protein